MSATTITSAAAGELYTRHNMPTIRIHRVMPDGTCSCRRASCWQGDKPSAGKHPDMGTAWQTKATIDPTAVTALFAPPYHEHNVGVVCSHASGLVMLDVDSDYGQELLAKLSGGDLPPTPRFKTGRGERFIYRNTSGVRLAERSEKNVDEHGEELATEAFGVLVGDGVQTVMPPSLHYSGRRYEWVPGASLEDLPIAPAPAWLIEYAADEKQVEATDAPPGDADGPMGDFNRRKDWRELYEAAGWTLCHERGDGVQHLTRAGKDGGTSATLGRCKAKDGTPALYNFSGSVTYLAARKAVDKFGFLARWKYRGDFTAAAKALRAGEFDGTKYGRQDRNADFSANGKHNTGGHPSNNRDSRDGFAEVPIWQPPAALPEMPPVPPFPTEVFPAQVADYWLASAESLGVPVDYVGVPGMSFLGASAGRSRALGVKKQYTELPALWTLLVGPPGTAKSPSLRAARGPISDAEEKWQAEHREKLLDFNTEVDRYKEKVKCWKAEGCEGPPPDKPKEPALRQMTLDECTTEAAAKVLADNPRGLILAKDEFDGFVLGMNQYRGGGKGNDKQFWLSAWAGATAKVNRSGTHKDGPLYIRSPFISMAGMMVPASLPNIRGGWRKGDATDDTGFPDRFLWSQPDVIPATGERWHEVPDDVVDGYANVMTALMGLGMVEEVVGMETRRRPYIVPLSDDGRDAYQHFTDAIAAAMNRLDPSDHYRGVLSKLKGYGCRLAIMLWCVRHVCGELYGTSKVDADTFTRAAHLVDYFETHARRCLGTGWGERKHRVAKRITSWLARNPDKTAFSRSEVFLQLKDRRDVTNGEALSEPLKVLTDHAYVRPLDPTGNGRPGPAPEVYAVNPLWVRSCETRP